jgi:hypothetical protein
MTLCAISGIMVSDTIKSIMMNVVILSVVAPTRRHHDTPPFTLCIYTYTHTYTQSYSFTQTNLCTHYTNNNTLMPTHTHTHTHIHTHTIEQNIHTQ